MELIEQRLNHLASFGVEEQKRSSNWDLQDDIGFLTEKECAAWAGLLASISTSEAMEGVLLEPLIFGMKDNLAVARWTEVHSQDEVRHLTIINRYLKNTFQYEKKKKSFTDIVLYEQLLPLIAKKGEQKPIYILAILYFYESFSIDFYKEFKIRAQQMGLERLVQIFRVVEKDELRHVAGIEHMIDYVHRTQRRPHLLELLSVFLILLIVVADINTSWLAFYNRRVRRNVKAIGIIPADMNRQAYRNAWSTLKLIRGNHDKKNIDFRN